MAGVVLIGAIAVFLAGLAVGIILASIMMHRDDRRTRLIGKVRALRPKPVSLRVPFDIRFGASSASE